MTDLAKLSDFWKKSRSPDTVESPMVKITFGNEVSSLPKHGVRQKGTMRFEDSAVVNGAPEEIFSLTQDYSRRLTWDPFLREATLLRGASAPAVGVRAWCVARSGIGMETEYVSYNPPRVVAVKMTRGPRLLESFAGTWEFEPMGEGKTKVTFRYHLRARPRFLAGVLEPLARFWFARETRLRLAALQRKLNEPAAKDTRGSTATAG